MTIKTDRQRCKQSIKEFHAYRCQSARTDRKKLPVSLVPIEIQLGNCLYVAHKTSTAVAQVSTAEKKKLDEQSDAVKFVV